MYLRGRRKRSRVLRRSEKAAIVGWSILLIGAVIAISTFAAISEGPDLISVQAAKSSSLQVLVIALSASTHLRVALRLMLFGLVVILIARLNKKDEDDGKAVVPSEFENTPESPPGTASRRP